MDSKEDSNTTGRRIWEAIWQYKWLYFWILMACLFTSGRELHRPLITSADI